MKKILFVVVLAFLGLAVSNCKATLRGVYAHESFTYLNIVKNRFLVGDVVFNDSLNFTGDSNRYVRILKERISEEKFKVLPSGLYKKKINQKIRKQIKENLQLGLGLEKKNLEVIKRELTQVKYLVFAIVDFDETTRQRKPTFKEGSKRTTGYDSISLRKMEASLKVYDTQQGVLVYSGSTGNTERNSATYDKKEEVGGLLGGIAAVVKASKGLNQVDDPDLLYPYPDYPTRDHVLQRVFSVFADSLPEED